MTTLACILVSVAVMQPGEAYSLHQADALMLPGGGSGVDRGSLTPRIPDFPDYTAPEAYFGPRRAGYTLLTELDEAILASLPIADLTAPFRGSALTQPVLVLTSELMVIGQAQAAYFDSVYRWCGDCVEVLPVRHLEPAERDLIRARVDFMIRGELIPLPALGYDTAVRIRQPDTWDEVGIPLPLSRVIRPALAGGELERLRFVREYLLKPHDLRYVRLVGPSPGADPETQGEPHGADTTPFWVRMRYAEWDDMKGAFRMASDAWIAGGWRHVRAACPDCETWSDWYCGSHGSAEWHPTRGAICRMDGDAPDRNLPGHGYLPGDTSAAGWQYTWDLRQGYDWPTYLENYTPLIDPEWELPALVRRQEARVRATAHELADRWCGEVES